MAMNTQLKLHTSAEARFACCCGQPCLLQLLNPVLSQGVFDVFTIKAADKYPRFCTVVTTRTKPALSR